MSGLIIDIVAGSIAEEVGIAAGDRLLSINDQPVRDLIDYNYYCADDYLELEIEKADGEIWVYEVEKYPEEELGLVFPANVFDGIRPCRNHCLFCFIDQLQPHPRPSLLLKDDDYRMSFLEGNFITCTNLTEADYQRIAELHLSPLYISVHSVDPMLRQRLLGLKQPAEILLTLQKLIAIGCRLHTQVVLCPGINDGAELDRTIDALASLAPGVATLAVVPVGLTRFQRNPALRPVTPEEAAALIDEIEARQQIYQQRLGHAFVYAADELYCKAGRPFPPAERYGYFEQIENGVGMASLFLSRWQDCRHTLPAAAPKAKIGVVTGAGGAAVLSGIMEEIRAASGADIELITVENRFYGPSVTASGLLTGSCIRAAVQPGKYDRLLLPANMLKFDCDVFLDDMAADQLATALDTEIRVVEPDPASLLAAVFDREASL